MAGSSPLKHEAVAADATDMTVAPVYAAPVLVDHVWLRRVTHVILPVDLAGKLHGPLSRWFEPADAVVVVERRSSDDAAYDGPERRSRVTQTAAEARAMLPRIARRHAMRILLVEDLVPVHQRDVDTHLTQLAARVRHGDDDAGSELDRRLQAHAHGPIECAVGRRHAHDVTRSVVDAVARRVREDDDAPHVRRWLEAEVHRQTR